MRASQRSGKDDSNNSPRSPFKRISRQVYRRNPNGSIHSTSSAENAPAEGLRADKEQREILSLILRAREDTGAERLRALETLIERFSPLIQSASRRSLLDTIGLERADLLQEAIRQFIDLATTFNPRENVLPAVYFQRNLHWRIANYLRAERRRSGHIILEEAKVEEIPDPVDSFAQSFFEISPEVERAIEGLTPRQRQVIFGLYWRDLTPKELSVELGIGQKSVEALRRRAEGVLRERLLADLGSGDGPSRFGRGVGGDELERADAG